MTNFPVTASVTGLTISDSIATRRGRAVSDFVFAEPFAVGTSVLDNFQRPNESPLSGGGRWTRTGTFGSHLNLVSHATVASTVSQIDSESYVAAGDLYDCEVWATLSTLPSAGAFDTAGVILRQNPATASQKDCYILAYETNGATLFLTYTDASGASTTLASWPLVLSNGDSIGLRAQGTTLTAYYRIGAGAWQVAGSVTDSNGSHGYIGLQQIAAGAPSAITNFGGGPVGVWDSIAPLLAPHGLFPDTGLTVTDSIARTAGRFVSDTALSVTDAMVVFLNGNVSVSLSDTGLALTDSIQKTHSTSIADTGLTVTDSTVGGPIRRALIVDAGLTGGDALAKHVSKLVSVTGLTVTDSLGRSHPVAIATTGLSVTDSIQKTARKVVTDTGLTLSLGLVVQKNGHDASVNLSDIGLSVTASLVKVGHYFRSIGTFGGDTGLTIRDGLRVRTSPPFKPTKPKANFTYDDSGLLLVAFTDTSTPGSAPIGSWSWTFGDGIGTSSATNPTYTYAAAGTYNVGLTVVTIYGTSHITKPITVTAGPVVAGFHIDAVIV